MDSIVAQIFTFKFIILTIMTWGIKQFTMAMVEGEKQPNPLIDIAAWSYAILISIQGIPYLVMYIVISFMVGNRFIQWKKIEKYIEQPKEPAELVTIKVHKDNYKIQ